MKISQALKVAPAFDPMMDPDLDGIAFAFAAGKLRREKAIHEWTSRGVEQLTAFRWITQAEGLST